MGLNKSISAERYACYKIQQLYAMEVLKNFENCHFQRKLWIEKAL
ncbi:hypothetical protein BA1DRAFT_00888 [Photorhabdus aegyptia]|uniref:Uncharacterized protein n=1 Tax=Photorhabdus aegyptia TaxID=2805098 RepID=A0A022PM54_9GAMM|nr:hypothetical protein BA1DRAFT_00888 [Photorhabdus aegyptia]